MESLLKKSPQSKTKLFNSNSSLEKDSISLRIAEEETYVVSDLSKKDPNAIFIEDNPQIALEVLLTLDKNQNSREKYITI